MKFTQLPSGEAEVPNIPKFSTGEPNLLPGFFPDNIEMDYWSLVDHAIDEMKYEGDI